jgi:biopolymer transport protein ExbD
MFRSIQRSEGSDEGMSSNNELGILNLIDVLFVLLLFFLITSSFSEETVVKVDRAQASTAETTESAGLRISITASGAVFTEGVAVELAELKRRVERAIARDRTSSAIVIPDRAVPAGRLVEVLDAVREAGIQNVAIAAERKTES